MSNIEKKESYIEELRLKEKQRLKKGGVLESYGGDIRLVNYGNIFGVKGVNGKENIIYFIDNKGNFLFQILGTIRDFGYGENKKERFETGKVKVNKILEKMGYRWKENEKTGIYYIKVLRPKKGERTEIKQDDPDYYEIFEILAFIDGKDTVINGLVSSNYFKSFVQAGRNKDTNNTDTNTIKLGSAYKYIADILEDIDKENKSMVMVINTHAISPLEFFSHLSLGVVEKQDILKYTKQIFNLEYFQNYYENKGFKLLEDKEFEILLGEGELKEDKERILFEEYKTYKISLKPSIKNIYLILEKVLPFVEKLELRNTKNKQEQEKIKQRYEELREYLNKKKIELKSTEKTKKHISTLKDNVIDNLG